MASINKIEDAPENPNANKEVPDKPQTHKQVPEKTKANKIPDIWVNMNNGDLAESITTRLVELYWDQPKGL
jgi:hypothetical protein